jgi:hypothetical protein
MSGTLLDVETAHVDEQRLVVGQAERAAKLRIAALRVRNRRAGHRAEHDDILDPELPEESAAAMFRQGVDSVELAVEATAVAVAEAARGAGHAHRRPPARKGGRRRPSGSRSCSRQ